MFKFYGKYCVYIVYKLMDLVKWCVIRNYYRVITLSENFLTFYSIHPVKLVITYNYHGGYQYY